jgi:hypothetical protein
MSDAGASGSGDDIKTPLTWNDNLEAYFCDTAEKAECLSWVHKRGEELYTRRKTFIDMPVIVLSSIVGFCSVGSATIFQGQGALSSVLLGVLSLLVSTINTTGSYFGWAKRAEGHRVSSIHYAKLYRFLKVELSLPRNERLAPQILLKYCKDQYDRLQEVSPLIPTIITKEFKAKFSKYKDIAKPEEMNGLTAVKTFVGDSVVVVTTPIIPLETQKPVLFIKKAPSSSAPTVKTTLPNPKQHVVDAVVNTLNTRRPSAFDVDVPMYSENMETKTDSNSHTSGGG